MRHVLIQPAPAARDRPDACPGALVAHPALDGGLVRLRLPGGRLTASAARELGECAQLFGDGEVHLTSRANLQLRGLRTGSAADVPDVADSAVDGRLVGRLEGAGLLPSSTHERARNIVASPLSGRSGGLLDVGPLVGLLDAGLCADPPLADLPGRFLLVLDDGSGDVAGLDADLGWWEQPGGGDGALLVAGVDIGLRVTAGDAVRALLAAASAFLAVRGSGGSAAWHVGELAGAVAVIGDAVRRALPHAATAAPLPAPPARARLAAPGLLQQDDGRCAVVAVPPLGVLAPAAVRALAAAADLGSGSLVVTPWREVVVPDLPGERAAGVLRSLAVAGLVVDGRSPWVGVTACAGRSGCARSLGDPRGDATRSAGASRPDRGADGGRPLLPVFWAGCGRRCGHPAGRHLEAVAGDGGYAVRVVGDGSVPAAGLSSVGPVDAVAAVAAARREV